MNKLITRLKGGIGNQMFIYAASKRLALNNNAMLILDNHSGFVRDFAFKRNFELDKFNIQLKVATPSERLEPFATIRRPLKKWLNSFCPYQNRNYLIESGMDFDSRLLNVKFHGSLYLEGYWQSYKYFEDIEDEIRNDYCIKAPKDFENLKFSTNIKNINSVALHIRFFDSKSFSGEANLSYKYYNNAISYMNTVNPNAHYFIFSDNIQNALKVLPKGLCNYTIVQHNLGPNMAYADLWLMSQCKHAIIANSTFSWWGAWLGSNPNQIVVAPSFKSTESSSWGFDGLLPDAWIII